MSVNRIIELYKLGYTIEYIINDYYKFINKKSNRVIRSPYGYVIFVNDKLSKSECSKKVYSTIYGYIKS